MAQERTVMRLSAVASFALMMWACGGRPSTPLAPSQSPAFPSAPSPGTPAPAQAIYTLSGVVFEMTPSGPAPVEGVQVDEWSCAPFTGCGTYVLRSATTNGAGFYSMSGLYAGDNNYFWAEKTGYDDPMPESTPCDGGCHILSVVGDTRFDMQLARR